MRNGVSDDFVKIEKNICPVCGVEHDVGIMINKRLKAIKDEHTVTGYSLCKQHKNLYENGYLALVGVDETKSTRKANGNLNFEDAYRTGSIAHIKYEVASEMFNVPIQRSQEFIFCDEQVIEMLKEKMEEIDE